MPFTRQLGRIQEHPHTGESVAFSHHPLTFHPLLLTSKINKRQVQQFSETLRLLNSAKKFKSAHLSPLFLPRSPAKKNTPPASKRHMLALVHALAMHARNYFKKDAKLKV